jgi:hypothetical protein
MTAITLLLAVAWLSGCGSKSYNTYAAHGVSFHYPKAWAPAESRGVTAKSSGGVWTEMLAPKGAGVTADIIIFTEFRAPVALTEKNLAASADSITASIAQMARQAGGSLLAGPTRVTMGGLPGYEFRITAKTPSGRLSASRLVIVWNGKTEYSLNCQHDANGSRADEIDRGCKLIVDSFKLD